MRGTTCFKGLLWAIGASVAASVAACSDTPTSPDRPPATYGLSGTVTEMSVGPVPVEGAVVTHIATGRSATTDTNGAYSITEIPASMATITVTKEGYETITRYVSVLGETRLDLQLVRRRESVPPSVLSGIVFEMTAAGPVPIPGVHVEDSNFHIVSVTDSGGRYRLDFSGVYIGQYEGFANLYVTKEGFQTITRWVPVVGGATLDIELLRR